MVKTLLMTMLLDFYGALLTEKQHNCFNLHYNEDMSLSEIAETMDISRQAVRDLIVRAESTLKEIEDKTGLVERFSQRRVIMKDMETRLHELAKITDGKAKEIAFRLFESLENMKEIDN